METSTSKVAAEKTATTPEFVNPLGKKVVEENVKEAQKLLEAAKKQATSKKNETKTPGKKTEGKAGKVEKKKGPTMASELDKIILAGGTFEAMIEAAQERSKKLGGSIKYNAGVIKAHIKFREIKNPKYLGSLKITDKGVFAKTAKSKAA
jgi:hypothetical protein